PTFMTNSTSMVLTILLRGWRWQKQPFRKHFASVQMPETHTGREQVISIMDSSITRALWLNWKLRAGACQMLRTYSRLWVTSKGVRAAGKSPQEISSGQLNSTRVPLTSSNKPDLVTDLSGVMLNKNRSWIAH